MQAFKFSTPTSLSQALETLRRTDVTVRPLAGGTDLIPQLRGGAHRPGMVMDIKRVPECSRLEVHDDGLHIGSAVPCTAVARHPYVKERLPMLAAACSLIGSRQIQNRASVGGNICNAAPSADIAPALLCLGATAVIGGQDGAAAIPIQDFFVGPGKTALGPHALLVEIIVPPPAQHSAGCYQRFTPRAEMDIAFAGVGSYLTIDPSTGVCALVRIALGAVGPTPLRAASAEEALKGSVLTTQAVQEAAQRAAADARPITDQRASANYRRELVKTLTRRTLTECAHALGVTL